MAGSSNRSIARTGSPGVSEPCATGPGAVPGGAFTGPGGCGEASPVIVGVGVADKVAPPVVGLADGVPAAGTQPAASTAIRAATRAQCERPLRRSNDPSANPLGFTGR